VDYDARLPVIASCCSDLRRYCGHIRSAASIETDPLQIQAVHRGTAGCNTGIVARYDLAQRLPNQGLSR